MKSSLQRKVPLLFQITIRRKGIFFRTHEDLTYQDLIEILQRLGYTISFDGHAHAKYKVSCQISRWKTPRKWSTVIGYGYGKISALKWAVEQL